ncbi:polysaccharide biosynthesis protein [Dokdonia sinensis]|uniref:Polysaccharide biosynthesis protein n=1 Tax=Dokdonia sinensis TaxID=2479847 RepID=A0A3M0GJT5_9FLAO|nr:oligosaccharide flippase family protein [Dokdonia sinensis]RMB57566.1 polysaccharide biosynthesis protein [Dokdonia sinensis]
MGIVIKQSLSNLITTFLGFGIGALNTLFFYVQFMNDTYYGLVGFLLSTAMLLMPIFAFGVHNTLIKFYSSYAGAEQDRFLWVMLLLPLIPVTIGLGVFFVFYDEIGAYLSTKNDLVADYVWYIVILAITAAYFEIFFAWARVQLKSIFGNFLKEVFHRLLVALLLLLLGYEIIDLNLFFILFTAVYILRMVIMKIYAFHLRMPKFSFGSDGYQLPKNFSRVIKYTLLIIIAGSVATMLLDIDKFMIGKYEFIQNVAYYSVAIYIATTIVIPQRAMHQITSPMVAKLLNEKNFPEIENLYKRSSLTLFIISSLLFLLIACNVETLYKLVEPQYADGLYVVLLIGLARVFDNVLGVNNAIIFNSDYYRLVLVIGVVLIFIAIGLNMWLIPLYGIHGAAVATFISSVGYGVMKIMIVQWKFKMHPFTIGTLKMILVGGVFFSVFYFWNFDWHPVLSILVKSLLLGGLFILVVRLTNISTDITEAVKKYTKF